MRALRVWMVGALVVALVGALPVEATSEPVGVLGPGTPGTVTDDHGGGTIWVLDVDVSALAAALVPDVVGYPNELSCDDPPLHLESSARGSPVLFHHQNGSLTLDALQTSIGAMNVWEGVPPDGTCTRYLTSSWYGESAVGGQLLVTLLRDPAGSWMVAGGEVNLPDGSRFTLHTDTPTGRTYMVEFQTGPDDGGGGGGGDVPGTLPETA